MVKFLIGGIAGFDTDTFALVSRHDSTQSVPLGAAAGRCLQVLLEADGEIVTKKTLLAQGWEQYGAVVSDNNLSQSIVRIRKALQQLGADPSTLITLPRIGYRIVGVERVSPHTSGQSREPSSDIAESKKGADDEEITQSETQSGDLLPTALSVVEVSETLASTTTSVRHGIRLGKATFVWLACAAMSAALALWIIPKIHGDLRSQAVEVQWEPLDAAPENRVFVPPDLRQDKAYIDDRLARLARTPPTSVDDLAKRLVYLNGSQGKDVASYFLCLAPISQPDPDCVSYLLIDHLTP
ncbi:winged helix-turn-helix domain-containing protein [Pandoraea sp. ISTKB]|uniref:winged helix-turn-helix domain-containing protein n=1 Tax=Pandoraea sp. ISTKB TaxID=1586708 RepID=UPI000846B538|nr:winged helix-turn-helix domain-containing protein [Pandoraea sp. ISTKB]ODP32480.1 hypothetical protein A9762_22855 [Pandoraea sp. ISTKB]